MKTIRLFVDATYGMTGEAGDVVHAGQSIGTGPNGEAVVSPVDGTITRIAFDPASHRFGVTIAARKES